MIFSNFRKLKNNCIENYYYYYYYYYYYLFDNFQFNNFNNGLVTND